ncbi:MAG: hypothetical protein JO006_19210 [Paucibacter sp.]|nr:hypothetical protein [Roseateles sp.]
MTSLRKRKAAISRQLLGRRMSWAEEDRIWDSFPPVGREFGSPDFERLMEEDYRNGVGVFDRALTGRFLEGVRIPADMRVQRRKRL